MQCPYCGHAETKVTNKREAGKETRRRRECLKCKKRFTTYERLQEIDLSVVKKDGRREHYKREKLLQGLMKACEKRDVSREKIDEAVSKIEEQLRKKGKEVKSSEVGELVMRELKKLDKVAYVRFASVYKDFKDIEDFQQAIKELDNNKKKGDKKNK